MNGRIVIFWVAACIAVVAAAVSGVLITNGRRDIALAQAAEAESAEARADEERKKAQLEKDAAEVAKAKAEAEAEKAKEERLAQEAKQQAEQLESENLAAKRAIAEKEAEAAKSRAAAAADSKEAARAEADKAKALAAAEAEKSKAAAAKAEAAAAELVKAEAKIAEAKALELRKFDFEKAERELAEWKVDLEERERALQPEKTVADLSWAGGEEDSVIDADGNMRKVKKQVYLAENDRSLPRATRQLAKTERVVREDEAASVQRTRANVVSALEKLYELALKENRVIDAKFYKDSLISLYPDWKYGEAAK